MNIDKVYKSKLFWMNKLNPGGNRNLLNPNNRSVIILDNSLSRLLGEHIAISYSQLQHLLSRHFINDN